MKFFLIIISVLPLKIMASSPCGSSGSVDARIKNCSTHSGLFDLVFRSKSGKEIWKDSKSNLMWSDELDHKMTHFSAMTICQTKLSSLGGIKADWRLPTSNEFKVLESNGAKEVLPNTSEWFWTSKIHVDFEAYAWLFSPYYNRGFFGHRDTEGAIRCVSEVTK